VRKVAAQLLTAFSTMMNHCRFVGKEVGESKHRCFVSKIAVYRLHEEVGTEAA
jgi:hypothetical protein